MIYNRKSIKPGKIVLVTKDFYRHYGEVMSFVTPEDTVMVRRVAGHPGTLEELPVSALEDSRRKAKYVAYATVDGRGQFPIDMLRYDYAAPVNFTFGPDRHGGMTQPIIDESFGLQGLWIAHLMENKREEPFCYARWRSFLWGAKLQKLEAL